MGISVFYADLRRGAGGLYLPKYVNYKAKKAIFCKGSPFTKGAKNDVTHHDHYFLKNEYFFIL